MSQPQLPFQINKMSLTDIPAVLAIEQAAYTSFPPKRNYTHELENNRLAHYQILRVAKTEEIVGVFGYWLIAGDAHIITIATHPHWQRLGLGEWLLQNLITDAQTLHAQSATLEVRPSNPAAISLYKKYNFQHVGHRSGYYSDNGEDALIFTTPRLSLPEYQTMLARHKTNLWQRLAQISIDDFSQGNRG